MLGWDRRKLYRRLGKTHAGGGGGIVVFRSDSSVDYGPRTNTVIPAPAGIQDDDVLLIIFEIGANLGTVPVPTPPAGFALLAGFPVTRNDGTFEVVAYAWVKIASGEAGNYTITHAAANSDAYMLAASGADTGGPIDPAPTVATGTENPVTAPGLTTTDDNSLIVYWCGSWNLPSMDIPPGGVTPVLTTRLDGSTTILFVSTGNLSPAGATGNKVATIFLSGNPDAWATGLIAIKPA